MPDRDKLKEKIAEAIALTDFDSLEARAEAALTAIEEAGYVIMQEEPMRSEDVFTGDDVENIAEWQEWASRTGNDQLAGMLRHWWKKAQKTAEALRALKRSPLPTEETDV